MAHEAIAVACRARVSIVCAPQASDFPDFVPQDKAEEIMSPQARSMLMNYERCEVSVTGLPQFKTSYVGPSLEPQREDGKGREDKPPIMMLHGFDSNALEFRNIYPYLCRETDAYAVDLIGCELDTVRQQKQHMSLLSTAVSAESSSLGLTPTKCRPLVAGVASLRCPSTQTMRACLSALNRSGTSCMNSGRLRSGLLWSSWGHR